MRERPRGAPLDCRLHSGVDVTYVHRLVLLLVPSSWALLSLHFTSLLIGPIFRAERTPAALYCKGQLQ